jgi:hypothetical protein
MKIKGISAKLLLGNVTMLNIILLVTAGVFLFYSLLPQYRMNVFSTSPIVKSHLTDVKTDLKSNVLSIPDYRIVSDQNLFHPERKIPAEKKAEDKSSPPMPEPEYILHGTLVSDTVSIAYLEDAKEPRNTPGRGKRQLALHINDILSGFTLKEINADRVVMVRGSEKITVSISDSHKKIKMGQIAQKSPTTVPVAQLQGSNNSVGTINQPQAEKKTEPPKRMIDQDVLNFFKKRQRQ